MSAESENVRDTLAEQLASFDDKLHATANDVDLLASIRDGIGRLLQASGNNEAEIRQVLQDRYDSGALRQETFQLVKSMLDRYTTENMPTSPDQEDVAPQQRREPPAPVSIDNGARDENQIRSTSVMPANLTPQHPSESHVQVGSLLRDRFLLQEKISGGSMGVVYKAMDRRLAETGSKNWRRMGRHCAPCNRKRPRAVVWCIRISSNLLIWTGMRNSIS